MEFEEIREICTVEFIIKYKGTFEEIPKFSIVRERNFDEIVVILVSGFLKNS